MYVLYPQDSCGMGWIDRRGIARARAASNFSISSRTAFVLLLQSRSIMTCVRKSIGAHTRTLMTWGYREEQRPILVSARCLSEREERDKSASVRDRRGDASPREPLASAW